jgi:outer membrane protein assembly factor BamB
MAGTVHALDLETAAELWAEPFEGDRGAIADLAALDGDGALFVPTLGRHVYLIDPETGNPLRRGRAGDALGVDETGNCRFVRLLR